MNHFELYETIKAYCENKNYIFIYGEQGYANALADHKKYCEDQYVFWSDPIVCRPQRENGKIIKIDYNCIFALGRKREVLTKSNLDETNEQKQERRLGELIKLLSIDIGSISCANELSTSNEVYIQKLNQFDLDIDFQSCTLTLTQE